MSNDSPASAPRVTARPFFDSESACDNRHVFACECYERYAPVQERVPLLNAVVRSRVVWTASTINPSSLRVLRQRCRFTCKNPGAVQKKRQLGVPYVSYAPKSEIEALPLPLRSRLGSKKITIYSATGDHSTKRQFLGSRCAAPRLVLPRAGVASTYIPCRRP